MRRSFGIRRVLCIMCIEALQQKDARFNLFVELASPVAFAAVGTILVVRTSIPDQGWVLLNIALFFFCIWLLLVPHELGHALAGRAAGFRIFLISIGIGNPIWRQHRGELTLQWCTLPLFGYVLAATASPGFYRTRLAVFVLGGLAVNAGLLALLVPGALPLGRLEERLESGFALMPVLAAANAWLLIVNLAPWNIRCGSTVAPSDGLQLIKLLFLNRTAIEEVVQLYPIIRWMRMRESSGREEAARWLWKELEGQPLSNIIRSSLGVALIDSSDFARARELFLECVEADEPASGHRWLFLNNLAYADLLLDDPHLLPEADRATEEALALAPLEPQLCSTRGSVLVRLGRVEEGIALLEYAHARLPVSSDKASTTCSLAEAFLVKGERQRARTLLTMTERLDASYFGLDRLRLALADPG